MFKTLKIILLVAALGGLLFSTANFAAAQSEADLVVEFENTPLFSQASFLPGESVIRWARVTNHSGETQTIGVQLINYLDPDGLGNQLNLEISQAADVVYNNTLASLAQAGETGLTELADNQTAQYDLRVTFSPDASNDFQGKTLSFDFVLGYMGDGGDGDDDDDNGGGGSQPAYGGYLRYVYPQGKIRGTQVHEWVILYNKSRNILYPGIIKIDLPEDYLKFISAQPSWTSLDQSTGQATWSTPLLSANGVFNIRFTLETLKAGDGLITHVYFDNQHVHLHETGRETIKPRINEQGRERWPVGGGIVAGITDTGLTAAPGLPGPAARQPIALAGLLNPEDGSYLVQSMLGDYQDGQVLGETSAAAGQTGEPGAANKKTASSFDLGRLKKLAAGPKSCGWWLWLVIAGLYGLIAYLHQYFVSRQKWIWPVPVMVILGIIYILYNRQCGAHPGVLVGINLIYLGILAGMSFYYIANLSTKIDKVRRDLKLGLSLTTSFLALVALILQFLINFLF